VRACPQSVKRVCSCLYRTTLIPSHGSKKSASHLVENRVFKPSKDFSKKARIGSLAEYKALWEESIYKPEKFWAREASELVWQQKWTKVLEWKEPFAKWFVGAET
jgi:acetyl-CoA synthetase